MEIFVEENMYFQNSNTTKQIACNSFGSLDFISDGLNKHSVGFRDSQVQVSTCSDSSIRISIIITITKIIIIIIIIIIVIIIKLFAKLLARA